jgi:hypothetical protein
MPTKTLALALTLTVALASPLYAGEIDWTKVDAAFDKTATVQGEVHRYGFPRRTFKWFLTG